jgi:hypothetical protein
MLSKCANPACSVPFFYLRDGKLFRVERPDNDGGRLSHNVEHFWLCRNCAASMTLQVRPDGEVSVVPLPAGMDRAA